MTHQTSVFALVERKRLCPKGIGNFSIPRFAFVSLGKVRGSFLCKPPFELVGVLLVQPSLANRYGSRGGFL